MTPASASCARGRDTARPGRPVAAGSVRTEGKHRPVRSAKLTRFCNVQCRCRRTVRYKSKVTGTKASMWPPGATAPARKRLVLGALCLCTPKGLAKIHDFGEARRRQTDETSPDFTEYADPPSEAGF